MDLRSEYNKLLLYFLKGLFDLSLKIDTSIDQSKIAKIRRYESGQVRRDFSTFSVRNVGSTSSK